MNQLNLFLFRKMQEVVSKLALSLDDIALPVSSDDH